MLTAYTPIFQVLKDGIDITSQLQDRLTEVNIEQTSVGEIARLELIFDDRDFVIALPQKSDKLSFLLGYQETGLSDFGTFEVDEIYLMGPPKALKVMAHGVSLNSNLKIPATKAFEGKTVGEIIKSMAGKTEVSVAPEIGNIKIPFFNQVGQSPFQVIDMLTRRVGGSAVYENGKITVNKRDSGTTVSGSSLGTINLGPEDFGEWNVWVQSRGEHEGAVASWWDKDKVKRIYETVKDPNKGFFEGTNGYDAARLFLMPGMFNSQAEAQAAAKAKVGVFSRTISRAQVTLAKGDPTVRVQQHMVIRGMRSGIDGDYIIDTVKTGYKKATGITTSIDAHTPSPTGGD